MWCERLFEGNETYLFFISFIYDVHDVLARTTCALSQAAERGVIYQAEDHARGLWAMLWCLWRWLAADIFTARTWNTDVTIAVVCLLFPMKLVLASHHLAFRPWYLTLDTGYF